MPQTPQPLPVGVPSLLPLHPALSDPAEAASSAHRGIPDIGSRGFRVPGLGCRALGLTVRPTSSAQGLGFGVWVWVIRQHLQLQKEPH